jgi:transaldolase
LPEIILIGTGSEVSLCLEAYEQMAAEGIRARVATLIFGLSAYEAVSEAYIAGLETLAGKGADIGQVASVASFFVSRVDSAVDEALSGNILIQGRIAIANSKAAYGRFREILAQERWQALARQGARVQRLLWASTGTKNPVYPDTFYVDALIGADTVNTVPPATLNAFVDHGTVAATLAEGLDDAKQQLAQIAEMGIDLEAITRRLLDEGVAAFAKSFESLMTGVHEKLEKFRSDDG